MTAGVYTVFILSKTYSTSVCHQHFRKTCHDCWGLHIHPPFKDLFNICLSPIFLQDLPWLLGSALYSSLQRLIQHLFVTNILQDLPWLLGYALYSSFQRLIQYLFVTNISTRHVMTDRVCTLFILSNTYSTSVCHQHFHKTCHDCWGLYCIHPFIYLFNICLSPTFLQDLPWLLSIQKWMMDIQKCIFRYPKWYF